MQRSLYAIALVLTLAGTIFLLSTKAPEERTLMSDDGRVSIVGTFLQSDNVALFTAPPLSFELYPVDKVLSTSATAIVDYHSEVSAEDASRLRLAYFDETFRMWRTVYTVIDPVIEVATAKIDRFGKWSLIVVDDVARPDFSAEIGSLITEAPEEAVGYKLEIGYADPPEDFVMLSGMGKSGGCGGQYKTGSTTRTISTVKTFSDTLEYQIVVVWQLADGCSAWQVIE